MVQAIDVNITFGRKILCGTMYIKLVAPDQLLLSDAVCHSLTIILMCKLHIEVVLLQLLIQVEETFSHWQEARRQRWDWS